MGKKAEKPDLNYIMFAWEAIQGIYDWEKLREPREPKVWFINLVALLRTMLGVYCLRYALLPVGILHIPGYRRGEGGYTVWTCKQLHIFGVRVARWNASDAQWVPDKPKLEVSDIDRALVKRMKELASVYRGCEVRTEKLAEKELVEGDSNHALYHQGRSVAYADAKGLLDALLSTDIERGESLGVTEVTDDWWKGVRALAKAVGATIDEDGMDVESAAVRLGGLLNAVSSGDPPETWSRFACPQEEDLDIERGELE